MRDNPCPHAGQAIEWAIDPYDTIGVTKGGSMRPKDYLLSIGEIDSIGRGRLSQRHKDICQNAVDNDKAQIDGYVKGNGDGTVAAAKPVAQVNNFSEAFIRFDPTLHKVVELSSGKERSLREACQNCGLSLIGHKCHSPVIVAINASGGVAVKVIDRKTGEIAP